MHEISETSLQTVNKKGWGGEDGKCLQYSGKKKASRPIQFNYNPDDDTISRLKGQVERDSFPIREYWEI